MRRVFLYLILVLTFIGSYIFSMERCESDERCLCTLNTWVGEGAADNEKIRMLLEKLDLKLKTKRGECVFRSAPPRSCSPSPVDEK